MKSTASYKCKLVNVNKSLDETIDIFRAALSFIVDAIDSEWSDISLLSSSKSRLNFVEKLIHKTKHNPSPKYDFDSSFYKLPSYLRREATSAAIGIVMSYRSNLANYNKEKYESISNGKKFKKKAPRLNGKHFKNPVLYKSNMFNKFSRNEMLIKVYVKNDWVWRSVFLREQDVRYIEKNCQAFTESAPTLVKSGRKYYLQFSYESSVSLNKAKLNDQIIVAVDLGINTSAVCSAIKPDGTVIDRAFINQSIEKDRQNHLLNRTKLKKSQTGSFKMPRVWNRINNLNTHIVNDTVSRIIKFAVKNNATTIVFEYLEFKGKRPKTIALKFNMWAKRLIQEKTMAKAHSLGIRYKRVNPSNTSALAFDGSGKVSRDEHNASLCTFTSGKQYNTDLNASYNIGARHYINEINKAVSAKKWSLALAKVPELGRRTQCTLSTLISISQVI